MRWMLLGIGVLTACGFVDPKPRPVYGGYAEGRPSVEGLPATDVPDSHLTDEMRVARSLSSESMAIADPTPPVGRSAEEIEAWTDQVLTPWITAKTARASDAKAELDRAALQNHRQRIMAGALVGLVYEDVARVVASVPVPEDFHNEPEIAQMFREVMESHALPYISQAESAYAACAANAEQVPSMRHWSAYCEKRRTHMDAFFSERADNARIVAR